MTAKPSLTAPCHRTERGGPREEERTEANMNREGNTLMLHRHTRRSSGDRGAQSPRAAASKSAWRGASVLPLARQWNLVLPSTCFFCLLSWTSKASHRRHHFPGPYPHTYIRMPTRVYVHSHACMRTPMHTHTHTRIHIHSCTHTYTLVIIEWSLRGVETVPSSSSHTSYRIAVFMKILSLIFMFDCL